MRYNKEKMSIGFIHNRLDWINKALAAELMKYDTVEVIDINNYGLDTHDHSKFPHSLYINRVYPSEAVSSYNNMRFMLEVVRHLESINVPVINSFKATFADYSKTESNSILESQDIPTARAVLYPCKKAAIEAGKHARFPKIIKMDCGGKAKSVRRANNLKEFEGIIENFSQDHQLIHVEDALPSVGYTTRIVVLSYEVVHISKRTLLDGWLGNSSLKGSSAEKYQSPPQSLYLLGAKTARALHAPIVALDVVETETGPYVVDVNTTPVFTPQSEMLLGFKPEEALAATIIKNAEHSNDDT